MEDTKVKDVTLHLEDNAVILQLADRMTDFDTRKDLSVAGVLLIGTPAQVGLIFESLRHYCGSPDIQGIDRNVDTLNQCEAALEKARQNADSFELHDPDNPM